MIANVQTVFARVRAALRRRGSTEHEAEDIVQEAWLRMASYRSPEPIVNPEGFLMRTALNLAANAHRDRQRHGEEVLTDDSVLMDLAPGLEAALLAKEQVARVEACLGRMSEQTREVFLLYRIDRLTYQEIGRRRGLSVSGVEWHVARANMLLVTWMDGW